MNSIEVYGRLSRDFARQRAYAVHKYESQRDLKLVELFYYSSQYRQYISIHSDHQWPTSSIGSQRRNLQLLSKLSKCTSTMNYFVRNLILYVILACMTRIEQFSFSVFLFRKLCFSNRSFLFCRSELWKSLKKVWIFCKLS